ncbi:aminomethyltransferase [Labrys miyagiensis]|uniref:aminomethyltransferase n=1 Tax=Labrys miyagiensis TaxID=346912 RepID=A0ABQ6CUU8_9HYPH|nr:glycine cleavage system aminomethyltransferase GcvT [Labrys miyagiensis]GLS23573.1 aminomethyltransferase [Labrys miyagiensis]
MADPAAGPDLQTSLLTTPLHAEHVALGARMVPFAGYDMPVQYPSGIIAEHNHTRTAAGLFDVSHMGQAFVTAKDGRKSHDSIALALETLVPADILNLPRGRQRYSQFLNEEGGTLDDLMIARSPEEADDGSLGLVVNAACKQADFELIKSRIGDRAKLLIVQDRALLALQGPQAAAVMADHCPDAAAMPFMGSRSSTFDGIDIALSRSGYTGEDGYEISVKSSKSVQIWRALLADERVKPIGLGARDSLRLEAGLCLYGHELDETISPIEAGLIWSIQKRRRVEGGFPGAARLQKEIAEGVARTRVGLIPEGRSPVRDGAPLKNADGQTIGIVTSGGFGPTVGGPVAIGYVPPALSAPGTSLLVELRGKDLPIKVAPMPFTPHRFHRG